VEREEPDGRLTGAWEAARQSGDSVEGGSGQNSSPVRCVLGLEEWEIGGRDKCGEKGRAPCPFIGPEGEQGG
jgi:hypothetical protein